MRDALPGRRGLTRQQQEEEDRKIDRASSQDIFKRGERVSLGGKKLDRVSVKLWLRPPMAIPIGDGDLEEHY